MIVIVVLLAQVFLVPLEISQQDEAPPLVEADQALDFLQNMVELCVESH